jgi:hypothetical protein
LTENLRDTQKASSSFCEDTRLEMNTRVPDERVQGLHQHASEEMSILGGFLPTLYRVSSYGTE